MISIPEVMAATATAFHCEAAELAGRQKGFTLARHVGMYLAQKLTGCSTVDIGRHFGRDHTTVMYAADKVAAELKSDARMAAVVGALSAQLRHAERFAAAASIDVLALVERVLSDPWREPYRVSVHDILALASTWRDLWETALAAEALAATDARRRALRGRDDLQQNELQELDDAEAAIDTLGRAIAEEMAALRGDANDPNTNKQEH